jgi:hypothetical protein
MGGSDTEGVEEEFILTPGNAFTYTLLTNSADNTVTVSSSSESVTVPVSNGNTITLNQSQIETLLDENEEGYVTVQYHTQGNTETTTAASSLKGELSKEFELKPYEQVKFIGLPKDSVYKIKELGSAGVEASYAASGFSQLDLKKISDNAEIGKDISTPQETMAFDREYTFINEKPLKDGWREVSGLFVVPPGVSAFRVKASIATKYGENQFWMDDVRVYKIW